MSSGGIGEGSKEEADAEQRYSEEEASWTETVRSNDGNDNSNGSKKSSKKPKRDWVDYATLVALIGALFAALYAGYEADRLASLSQVTLTDAREATVDANRAWLAVRGMKKDTDISTTDQDFFDIFYDNVGHEPAQDIVLGAKPGVIEGPVNRVSASEIPFPENQTCKPPMPRGVIAWPGAANAPPDKLIIPVDAKQWKALFARTAAGEIVLYFEGCLSYTTFKAPHQTAFCFYVKPFKQEQGAENKLLPNQTEYAYTFAYCPRQRTAFAN